MLMISILPCSTRAIGRLWLLAIVEKDGEAEGGAATCMSDDVDVDEMLEVVLLIGLPLPPLPPPTPAPLLFDGARL